MKAIKMFPYLSIFAVFFTLMSTLNCADVNYNHLDNMGMSPLLHACASRGLDLASTHIELGSLSIDAHTTKIVKMDDRLKVINYLLDHGALIDAKARDGKTALHFACYNGYLEIIDLLLSRGADTTITCPEPFYDDWGMLSATFDLSAQGLGVAYDHHEILPVFEKYGKLSTGAIVGRYS